MSYTKMEATISNLNTQFTKFESESANNKVNLILFLADKDPTTSLSWCPDCVRAEPIIYSKVDKLGHSGDGGVSLLTVYVGDKPTWRNPNHPLRIDTRFRVSGVPTLVRWGCGAVLGRLEDHEAHVAEKIDALVA